MKALKEYMALMEMSQVDLARRLSVTPAQLSHWLCKRRSPSAENLKHISKKTGISADKLLEDL